MKNETENNNVEKKQLTEIEMKSLKNTTIIIAVIILLGVIFALLFYNDLTNNNPKYSLIKANSSAFIYYNNEFYYFDENVCVSTLDAVGEIIDTVDYHLTYEDFDKNGNFKYYEDDGIYAVNVSKDANIYNYLNKDDTLLVENVNAVYGYSVYSKTPTQYKSIETIQENIENYDNIKVIGIYLCEILNEVNMDNIKKNPSVTSSGNMSDYFMPIYLLIEEDGVCRKYDGFCNMFSNILFINDRKYINEDDYVTIQYVYKENNICRQLITLYAEYFDLDKQKLLDALDSEEKESNVTPIVTPSPIPSITPTITPKPENTNNSEDNSLNFGQDNLKPLNQ